MRNILNSRSMSFDLSKENRINFDLYDMRQSFNFFPLPCNLLCIYHWVSFYGDCRNCLRNRVYVFIKAKLSLTRFEQQDTKQSQLNWTRKWYQPI